jgi:uncharacterized protein (DUF305 family)
MFKPRTAMAIAGALAVSLALSACSTGANSGSTSSSSSSASTKFNTEDVNFATDMTAHHQQAIEMAQMVLDKSGIDPRVSTLAQNIKAAQGPEIKQMKSWLAEWGQNSDSMSGMDMSGTLMSDSDMKALEESAGLDASKLFLTQMTTHHKSAVTMATTEVDKGKNTGAVALAKKIIAAQTAEISTMSDILATL